MQTHKNYSELVEISAVGGEIPVTCPDLPTKQVIISFHMHVKVIGNTRKQYHTREALMGAASDFQVMNVTAVNTIITGSEGNTGD